jgi:murein DD-endopeptidase MepM/ murein hydrolase activator NlpD
MTSISAEILRGYGQIMFCGRRRSGLLVLAATLAWPLGGVCGILGALSASLLGRRLPLREVLTGPGLYACNGALAGIALAVFGPGGVGTAGLAALAGAVAALLLYVLSAPLAELSLPPLSLPFVLATWAVLVLVPHPPPLAHPLPVHPTFAFHILGLAVFTWSGTAGLLLVLAVLLHARWQAAVLICSLPIAVWVAALASGGGAVVPAAALNMALTLVAVSIVFVPGEGVFLGLAGSAAALLLTLVMDPLAAGLQLPLLVAPFNLATLATLFAVRRPFSAPRYPAYPLAPPFFGAWRVSQGPGGSVTHQGEGRWAWDFVVADEQGRTHRGLGLSLDEYYGYGIPVRAAGDGVVARVVDGIADNVPPRENGDEPWGNFVIVEHGPGIFSEISHFQCGSISVRPGERVRRGQILGRCGNSGRSLEPHIHIQLQAGDYPGAPSVPTTFVWCRVDGRRGEALVPAEGEVVRSLD